MVHTWEHDRSTEVASATWHAADGEGTWALLPRVLRATSQRPSSVEPTTGRVNVYRPEGEGVASELWPERSFDGREDVPCSVENVALLRDAVAAFAQRTGGTVRRP